MAAFVNPSPGDDLGERVEARRERLDDGEQLDRHEVADRRFAVQPALGPENSVELIEHTTGHANRQALAITRPQSVRGDSRWSMRRSASAVTRARKAGGTSLRSVTMLSSKMACC